MPRGQEGQFEPGQEVEIRGLQKAPKYNGTRGVVVGFTDNGRVQIRLEDGETKAFNAGNLVPFDEHGRGSTGAFGSFGSSISGAMKNFSSVLSGGGQEVPKGSSPKGQGSSPQEHRGTSLQQPPRHSTPSPPRASVAPREQPAYGGGGYSSGEQHRGSTAAAQGPSPEYAARIASQGQNRQFAQLLARLTEEIEASKPSNVIHFVVDFLCAHYPEHLHGFSSIWSADPELERERQDVCRFFRNHKISTQIAAHFTNAGYDTIETIATLTPDALVNIEAFNNVHWLPGHKVRLQKLFSDVGARVREFKSQQSASVRSTAGHAPLYVAAAAPQPRITGGGALYTSAPALIPETLQQQPPLSMQGPTPTMNRAAVATHVPQQFPAATMVDLNRDDRQDYVAVSVESNREQPVATAPLWDGEQQQQQQQLPRTLAPPQSLAPTLVPQQPGLAPQSQLLQQQQQQQQILAQQQSQQQGFQQQTLLPQQQGQPSFQQHTFLQPFQPPSFPSRLQPPSQQQGFQQQTLLAQPPLR